MGVSEAVLNQIQDLCKAAIAAQNAKEEEDKKHNRAACQGASEKTKNKELCDVVSKLTPEERHALVKDERFEAQHVKRFLRVLPVKEQLSTLSVMTLEEQKMVLLEFFEEAMMKTLLEEMQDSKRKELVALWGLDIRVTLVETAEKNQRGSMLLLVTDTEENALLVVKELSPTQAHPVEVLAQLPEEKQKSMVLKLEAPMSEADQVAMLKSCKDELARNLVISHFPETSQIKMQKHFPEADFSKAGLAWTRRNEEPEAPKREDQGCCGVNVCMIS